MPPRTLANLGLIALVLALLLPWGYTRWLKTRMFEPVDKEVELEAGRIQTENFEINLREVYHVQIDVDYSSDYWVEEQTCPFRYWEAADWRVYQLSGRGKGTRELWASSAEMREQGAIPIGFKGRSGKYQLEWSVPATSVCLNARHPRLRVYTSSSGYEEFGGFLLFVCIFLGGTGIILVLRVIGAWMFDHFVDKRSLRMFPEMVLQNTIPRKRHRPVSVIKGLPNFGMVYGFILWVVMFIFMILAPLPPQGLLVNFRQQIVVGIENSPWSETVSVYIDARKGFLVNRHPVRREELRVELKKELSRQMVWTVYLEADPDCSFMEVVQAMDTIQGLGAKLIWVTPKTREEWNRKNSP